jgi:hypothetical protein
MIMTKAQVDMGDNLTEAAAALGEPLDPKPLQKAAPKKAKPVVEEKVRIMLEDNDQIPPGGQFIQVNGRSFLIQAGHEVEVPHMVLDALDHAVMSVAITDAYHSVIGYRDRLRFPYRVITDSRRSAGER